MRTGDRYPLRTLPDYLRLGLNLVFVGINPGLYSVQRGHYFARSTSRFWPAFSASKLSERVRRAIGTVTLCAEQDAELPRFGIGFTDVVKRPTTNAADLDARDFARWAPLLLDKLQRYQPRVACFHGLTAYRPFLKFALKSADPLRGLAASGKLSVRLDSTSCQTPVRPTPISRSPIRLHGTTVLLTSSRPKSCTGKRTSVASNLSVAARELMVVGLSLAGRPRRAPVRAHFPQEDSCSHRADIFQLLELCGQLSRCL